MYLLFRLIYKSASYVIKLVSAIFNYLSVILFGSGWHHAENQWTCLVSSPVLRKACMENICVKGLRTILNVPSIYHTLEEARTSNWRFDAKMMCLLLRVNEGSCLARNRSLSVKENSVFIMLFLFWTISADGLNALEVASVFTCGCVNITLKKE